MASSVHHLSFRYEARYFIEGPSVKDAELIFLCLHGYGQLAPYFIKKFTPITDRSLVIVPEGLHRFYSDGNHGRVGASWMTKEDREVDIGNYLRYLDSVVEEVMSGSEKSLVVIGFSQGAATAGRWTANTSFNVSDLVLWSGMFPHDVDVQKDLKHWNSMDVHALIGDNDPYVNDERFISEKEIMEQKGLDIQEIKFKGGHEIRPSELQELRDRILRKR